MLPSALRGVWLSMPPRDGSPVTKVSSPAMSGECKRHRQQGILWRGHLSHQYQRAAQL